jgi:dephospho-CoA kinase
MSILTGQSFMNTLSPMGKAGKKPVIGIIGGMCSGKSTAAAELGKLGCAVIDADEIAHQLLDDKKIRARVVRVFGKDILDSKGRISRGQLANIVFSDPVKLKKLTDILHPLVSAEVERLTAGFSKDISSKAIVLDMPLLMEVGWEKRCDYVIFIDCKPQIRLERAKKTGFFDAHMLKIRENLQISLDKKKRIADNIVDNNSDLSGLSKQIADIFSSIIDRE